LKHKGGCVLDGQYADYSATTASLCSLNSSSRGA